MATDIGELLNRLGARKRGKGRLGPAANRDGLAVSIAEALPSAADPRGFGGIASPLTEVGPTQNATTFSLTSSDGLFVLTFDSETEYLDANGDTVVITHKDPSL